MTETGCTVAFRAVTAQEALFEGGYDGLAPEAFCLGAVVIWLHHGRAVPGFRCVTAASVVEYTLLLHAQPQHHLAPAQPCEVFCEVLNYFKLALLEALKVDVAQALVAGEPVAVEVLVADAALDHDVGAVALDVPEELLAREVLIGLIVADVAAVLGTLVDRVLRELAMRLPEHLAISFFIASVRKLAEVYTIFKLSIHRL